MDALWLGILAALLQIAGYAFYGSKILSRDIKPNAISWLMFAYGTILLLIVEWDRDASFALLALPAACAISSVVVAFYALRKVSGWRSTHVVERLSFGIDVLLTVLYLATWILLAKGVIGEGQKDIAEVFILMCWNIGIFTAFFPLLRQVYRHPYTEHALPWFVWSVAYVVLAVVTFIEERELNVLILYPLVAMGVHGFIAIHTSLWRYGHKLSPI